MPLGTPSPSPWSIAHNIAPYASGGQANAVPLPAVINHVVCNTAASSVMLPSESNVPIWVINAGPSSLQVFAQVGDTIADHNSNTQVATGTGVALASAASAAFIQFLPPAGTTNNPTAANWKMFLGA